MPYVRKTRDEFRIEQHTAEGWEEATAENTRKEAKQRLKEYRENQPEYPARMRKVRVAIAPPRKPVVRVGDLAKAVSVE